MSEAAPAPDDKSAICIPFILSRLAEHTSTHSKRPFFLGLNGIQGAGKTTLVNALRSNLSQPPHSHNPVSFSIDDFYLPHDSLKAVAAANPGNPLLQQRGQPSTHDLPLLLEVLSALRERRDDVRIPRYDKSAHNGQGDRAEEGAWDVVNRKEEVDERKVDVVLFEGWCAGFRALDDVDLVEKWKSAVTAIERKDSVEKGDGGEEARKKGRLGRQRLDDLRTVNEALKGYDAVTDDFDAFIHLDAEDTNWVYEWRLEAETELRKSKGKGMSDEGVVEFVNGYYPAYELFTSKMRSGIFLGHRGKHLRIVVSQDRRMKHSEVL